MTLTTTTPGPIEEAGRQAVPWDAVVAIVNERRSANTVLLNEMLEVRRRYNGDIVVPLPDVDTSPVLPQITPALIAESIDSVSLRAASTSPSVFCPPLDPSSGRSKSRAGKRRKILAGTWFESKQKLLLRRAYRHMAGYATASLVIIPDWEKRMPVIEIRDPLGTYPETKAAEDLSPPANCAFIYERSATWIRDHYPAARLEQGGPIGKPGATPETWDLCEWIDDCHCMVGILGPRDPSHSDSAREVDAGRVQPYRLLYSWRHNLGVCPVITLPRVTLDRIASAVAHTIGQVDLMAKLMALAIVAEERAIFPDTYVIVGQNETGAILTNGGQWADGRTGQTNVIQGAQTVGQLNTAPPQSSFQMIDRIERNMRVSTGLVPQYGGEQYGALRTGRAMDALMGNAVDPRVQELQEIIELGMAEINRVVLRMWEHFWPDEKRQLFTGWAGAAGMVEFVPRLDIEAAHDSIVSYAIPGADVQGVTVQLGQLLGTKAIGLASFRRKHPWIEDADAMAVEVEAETLSEAAYGAILQQVQAGSMPLPFLAKIERHVREGETVFAAIEKADAELREEQAAQPPEPAPEQVAAPEMMPGIAATPDQMNGPMPEGGPQIGPTSGQQGLASLLGALRSGT